MKKYGWKIIFNYHHQPTTGCPEPLRLQTTLVTIFQGHASHSNWSRAVEGGRMEIGQISTPHIPNKTPTKAVSYRHNFQGQRDFMITCLKITLQTGRMQL